MMLLVLYSRKHPGYKQVRGQSEAALQAGT